MANPVRPALAPVAGFIIEMSRDALFLLALALSVSACSAGRHAAGRVQVIQTPNGGMVPDAEIDPRGVLHLAYVSGEDVYYVKSSDRGQRFSAPIRVNSEPGTAYGGAHRGPDLAVGGAGRIHIIWYPNAYQRGLPKEQWGVFYTHLNASGTAFDPSRNLSRRPSDNYSLAADSRGRVAVFWMAGQVYFNLSDDAGEHFSKARPLVEADPCECCASRAYYSTGGNLYFSYRDKAENKRDMYLMVLAQRGEAFSRKKLSMTPWVIAACPMSGTYLSGRYGLSAAWESKGRVYFAHLDSAGHPIAPGEIKAADSGKYPVALRAPEGNTLVAWKKGATLEWQMYDSSGKPRGKAGSAPVDHPDRFTGVVTGEGDFLLFP